MTDQNKGFKQNTHRRIWGREEGKEAVVPQYASILCLNFFHVKISVLMFGGPQSKFLATPIRVNNTHRLLTDGQPRHFIQNSH